MGGGWLAVGLCLLAVHWQVAAAGPTQNPWVVTKDDGETTTASSDEGASEGPLSPIKLMQMEVDSLVSLRYARTSVVTRVRNPAARAQETSFRVLLPETAFISGFKMTLDNKTYKAFVQEKKDAEKTYLGAVSEGVGAALVATKARDSNHFMVVVNVEPKSVAVFNLTYEELLERRNGVYNHAINLHPGTIVPKLDVRVRIKEAQKITVLRVPAVRTGNEVDATEEDPQNPDARIERGHDDREASVLFSPGEAQQMELIKIYAEKSKESSDRFGRYEEEESQPGGGVLGQFVVQYDVARPDGGEILVNDGYFVHFFSPPNLPPLPKHVVFVLDTSGSMEGRKIDQLRTAIKAILSSLHPGDYFNIVEFATRIKVYDLAEAEKPQAQPSSLYQYEKYEGPVALVPPAAASAPNIDAAKVIVDRFRAEGGTNIALALEVALDLVNKGVNWTVTNDTTDNTHVKEASTTEEPLPKPEKIIRRRSTEVENELNKPEPIIIFLTDGDATVGERDPQRIVDRVVEKNYGDNKASIFSLAFGKDAERTFLRKLSLRNAGFMRHIYEAADAARQLHDFYRQVASPLLANVTFVYPKEQVVESSLTRHKFRLAYGGGEAAVAGRAAPGAGNDIEPVVYARRGTDPKRSKPKVTVVPSGYLPLERVWAYLTVRELLDRRDALGDQDAAKRALEIALKYEFVTPLTSLVVVKPNATSAVDVQSVDDPIAEYSGFQGLAPAYAKVKGLRASRPHKSALTLQPLRRNKVHRLLSDSDVAPSGYMAQGAFMLKGAVMPMPARSHISYLHMAPVASDVQFESYAPLMAAAYQYEDEHLDSVDATESVASTTVLAPGPLSPLLLTFKLEEYPWTEPLIDLAGDALAFTANGTDVVLKLTRQPEDLKRGTAPCANPVSGVKGFCVYLTQCERARSITAATYQAAYCRLGGGDDALAGVCCPSIESESQED